MIRKVLSALALGLALLATDPTGLITVPAAAQQCLSPGDVRQAVASGQAIALSSVLSQIRATVGGDILPSPMLCDVGGRLVYFVNVLSDGQVTRLQVDAQTGSISY